MSNCRGSGFTARAETDGRCRCPWCGHRIRVTVAGKFRRHNGRRDHCGDSVTANLMRQP